MSNSDNWQQPSPISGGPKVRQDNPMPFTTVDAGVFDAAGDLVAWCETRSAAQLFADAPAADLLLRAIACGVIETFKRNGDIAVIFGDRMQNATKSASWSALVDSLGGREVIEAAIAEVKG